MCFVQRQGQKYGQKHETKLTILFRMTLTDNSTIKGSFYLYLYLESTLSRVIFFSREKYHISVDTLISFYNLQFGLLNFPRETFYKYFKQEPIQRRFDFSDVLFFGWPNQPPSGTMRVYIQCKLSLYLKKAGLASRKIVHH